MDTAKLNVETKFALTDEEKNEIKKELSEQKLKDLEKYGQDLIRYKNELVKTQNIIKSLPANQKPLAVLFMGKSGVEPITKTQASYSIGDRIEDSTEQSVSYMEINPLKSKIKEIQTAIDALLAKGDFDKNITNKLNGYYDYILNPDEIYVRMKKLKQTIREKHQIDGDITYDKFIKISTGLIDDPSLSEEIQEIFVIYEDQPELLLAAMNKII